MDLWASAINAARQARHAPRLPGCERLTHGSGRAPAAEHRAGRLLAQVAQRAEFSLDLRLTVGDHPYKTVLWPKLTKLLRDYPDIKVDIVIDNSLTDIAADGFDAGVRLGEQVAKDMIAVRIGPDVRFAVIGAKSYFANHPPPLTPQQLTDHSCINLRLPTRGGLWAWDFERNGRELKVRVEGRIILNDIFDIVDAAVEGFGLAYVPEDLAELHIRKGRLMRVLDAWCPPWPGYHLYFPSRRQTSPVLTLLIEALRYRQ